MKIFLLSIGFKTYFFSFIFETADINATVYFDGNKQVIYLGPHVK